MAAVPGGAPSIAQAKEALKPEAVQLAQVRHRVKGRERNTRRNRAFCRQGEWFFLPVSNLKVDPRLVLRNEAIRRGDGKPHIVDELYRTSGTSVAVCDRYPNGLSQARYKALLSENPEARHWHWTYMSRAAIAYVRGRVRHPDHATLRLADWHRVVMNTESETRTMDHMAFLD